MTTLKVTNTYSWLVTENLKIKETLHQALRFRERNYIHSRLYKQHLWDGYTEFFKKESGRFLTGLLPEVQFALQHTGVPYKIEDARQQFEFKHPVITSSFLEGFRPAGLKKIELRDYQVDLSNKIAIFKRGIIQAPTSAGKTNIMLATLIALGDNVPTLFLANKKGLVQQNYDDLKRWGVKNVGRLYDRYMEPSMITCATVQSLHKIEKLLPKIRALVVDEIHEMTSKIPLKFYNKMKMCSVRVAVSATPFKFGEKDKPQKYLAKGHFGPIMTTKTAGESGILTTRTLQDKGILSKSICTFYPINEPKIPYDIYRDAVTNGIAESWHFHKVVTRLALRQSGRTLILVERLQHGDALQSLIPDALWIQGKDDLNTRQEVIDKLQNSDKDVVAIATQGIFNTGINVFVHNLINAAGGQAEHQIIQRMGRGLRTADDKSILNYYDFVFNINDYLLEHSKKRLRILKKEGHEIIVKNEIDF